MRHVWLAFAVLAAACGGADESVPVDSSTDAPGDDAAGLDGPDPIDAPIDAFWDAGPDLVACSEFGPCTLPEQACCDVTSGMDTCIPQGSNCEGVPMMCDGPEDCPEAQECCLFEGQNARCLDDGICGSTGSISDVMCHTPADCPVGLDSCCGTAPGPAIDIWFVCRSGGCPQ